jgi:hypothetical protein
VPRVNEDAIMRSRSAKSPDPDSGPPANGSCRAYTCQSAGRPPSIIMETANLQWKRVNLSPTGLHVIYHRRAAIE